MKNLLKFHPRRFFRFVLNVYKYLRLRTRRENDVFAIIENHFTNWSEVNHQNRHGLTVALAEVKSSNPFILETGTSAYGTDSSRLFDAFVSVKGGTFHSIDLNRDASRSLFLQHSRKTFFHISDSVKFILNELPQITDHIDLCYLDSWDVDWSNPLPSALHGLSEFNAVRDYLKPGSVLVVDDTPNDIHWIPNRHHDEAVTFKNVHGVLPGKGAFIHKIIKSESPQSVLWHGYNLVIKF
jgi:hypothetical protein